VEQGKTSSRSTPVGEAPLGKGEVDDTPEDAEAEQRACQRCRPMGGEGEERWLRGSGSCREGRRSSNGGEGVEVRQR
jgi:hypothetical protein